MNRFISLNVIESIIDNLPKQKRSGPVVFTNKVYKTFKEIVSILYNFL